MVFSTWIFSAVAFGVCFAFADIGLSSAYRVFDIPTKGLVEYEAILISWPKLNVLLSGVVREAMEIIRGFAHERLAFIHTKTYKGTNRRAVQDLKEVLVCAAELELDRCASHA